MKKIKYTWQKFIQIKLIQKSEHFNNYKQFSNLCPRVNFKNPYSFLSIIRLSYSHIKTGVVLQEYHLEDKLDWIYNLIILFYKIFLEDIRFSLKQQKMTELKREYVIPLRRKTRTAPTWRRTKKAVSVLKDFVKKHMKTDNVIVCPELNEHLWGKGIKNPPGKVEVIVLKATFGNEEKTIVNLKSVGIDKYVEAYKAAATQVPSQKEEVEATAKELKAAAKTEKKEDKKEDTKEEPKVDSKKKEAKKDE